MQAELERLDVAAEQGDQIEELLDEREGGAWHRGHRQRLFLVRWKGYERGRSTWQSAAAARAWRGWHCAGTAG